MMNYYGYHMVRPMHPAFGFGWIFGVIFWILFICLIVGLVKWYISDNNKKLDNDEEEPSRALDILKERYAKGDITSREFEKMKKDIS